MYIHCQSVPTLHPIPGNMHQVKQFVGKEFYCFDCDGVLWRGKEPIPEARELLIKLREAVKSVNHGTNLLF